MFTLSSMLYDVYPTEIVQMVHKFIATIMASVMPGDTDNKGFENKTWIFRV